jgi:hypothetical protein
MAEETRKGYLRLNHFHGLRLESEDFETGERYHVEKRKLHNRLMHGAGVVRRWQGELKVSARRRGDMSVDVATGYAVDGNGNDLILWEPKIITIDPAKMLPKLPATAHIVLKYVDDPNDFVVNKANPKFKGHRRVLETVRIDVEAKAPDPTVGVELARFLITEETREIADARDPMNPGPGEIDTRFQSQAGAVGTTIAPDLVNSLRTMFAELRGSLGGLARNGVHSARDLRSACMTLAMLLESGTLDATDFIKGVRLILELAEEMRSDVDANFPELNGVREWEQWKEIIEGLKGVAKEAKPLRGDLENLVMRLSGAVGNLRLASDVKPAPKPEPTKAMKKAKDEPEPEEEKPPEPEKPAKKADAVELTWEQLKETSTLPKHIYLTVEAGQPPKNFELVDSINIGDRGSELEHGFGIEGAKQDWQTNQSFSYPDGKTHSARGKAHVGGLSKWNIKNLVPGKDVVVAKRIDFVRGDIVTRMEIDGKAVGDWRIDGSDRKHRWRNWLFRVPGDNVKKDAVECRQVAVEADRDINMFGLWFYQAKD